MYGFSANIFLYNLIKLYKNKSVRDALLAKGNNLDSKQKLSHTEITQSSRHRCVLNHPICETARKRNRKQQDLENSVPNVKNPMKISFSRDV